MDEAGSSQNCRRKVSDRGKKSQNSENTYKAETSRPFASAVEELEEMESTSSNGDSSQNRRRKVSDCEMECQNFEDTYEAETKRPFSSAEEERKEMGFASSDGDSSRNSRRKVSHCGKENQNFEDTYEPETKRPSSSAEEEWKEMGFASSDGDSSQNCRPNVSGRGKKSQNSADSFEAKTKCPSFFAKEEWKGLVFDSSDEDDDLPLPPPPLLLPHAGRPQNLGGFMIIGTRNNYNSPMTLKFVFGSGAENCPISADDRNKFMELVSSKDAGRSVNVKPEDPVAANTGNLEPHNVPVKNNVSNLKFGGVPVASTSKQNLVNQDVPVASSSSGSSVASYNSVMRTNPVCGVLERIRGMQAALGSGNENRNAHGNCNERHFQQSLTPVPDLPHDALGIIFSYLTHKDIYNMQFVCKLWYQAVHKPWLWIGYVFEVKHGMPLKSVVFRIQHLHAIHNIKCGYILPKHDADMIFTEMIDNMDHLKVIHFYGGVPAEYAEKIAKKYTNLKSMTLNFYAEDVVESLGFLSSCEELTELIFTGIAPPLFSLQRNAEAMNLLATGFPHLQHLDIRGTLHTLIRFNTDHYKTVLKAKASQLLSLKFTFDDRMNANVLKNINECTKLEHLQLELDYPRLPCTFENLTNLKSLALDFHRTDPGTLDDVFENSFVLSNMPFLRSLKVCVQKVQVEMKRFLNKVIEEVPQLEELELIGVNVDHLSSDLMDIRHLSNLRLLSLRNCFTANDWDIRNISLCRSLECLKIGCSDLSTAAIDYLADCTTLRSLLFTECHFGEGIVAYIIQKLDFLESLSLSFVQYHSVDKKTICRIRDEVHPNLKLHII